MLIENLKGGYLFLRGIAPYSSGVVAVGGFEIERARLVQPLPFAAAFERIEAHLEVLERPPQSLCGLELRSPCPLTFTDFDSFNGEYVRYIEKLGLPVDGLNPVARTNVAPEGFAPPEPAIYAFSYTVPSSVATRSFVVAGTGELPEGSLNPREVVRKCESSVEALIDKARYVHAVIDARVRGLGVTWENVTSVNVYTVHEVPPAFVFQALLQIGYSNGGVTWHYTRPPIVSVEYEMDVRGCAREIILKD
jgi:hypothetical protein